MTDEEKKAAIEAAEAKAKELQEELDKQKAIVENAEKKFNKWSNERGDERTAVAEMAKELKAASEEMRKAIADQSQMAQDLAEAKRGLAEAKKEGPTGEKEQSEKKATEKTVEELEDELTDAQGKVLDEAFKKAPDELKASIKSDPKVRKAFLVEAVAAADAAALSDLSDWRKKPAQKKAAPDGDAEKERIQELFKTTNRQQGRQPDGPTSAPATDSKYQRPAPRSGNREGVLR